VTRRGTSDGQSPDTAHFLLCTPSQGGSSGLTVGDLSLPSEPECFSKHPTLHCPAQRLCSNFKLDLEPRIPLECLETPSAGPKQAGHRMTAQ
jgi:hypothetical protein